MTLKDFIFDDTNHLIGLQQHAFFGKSVFLILVTKNFLIGLELNKSLSVENTPTLWAQATPEKNTPRGSFSNPYSYLKEKYVRAVEKKYLFDQSIQSISSRNFRIDRIDIENVHYEPVKIAGFDYPHEGRLHIRYKKRDKTSRGSRTKHEASFIILGEQKAAEIARYITKQPAEEMAL
ncbi:hypothetical protein ACFOW1_15050 [Parasediminibacterium paludis]|uniref:Uncharacterized protein n=1 Tax=Parasediminibacterium paludis TaxID=908966 RepID=A0ABV8PZ11_9BACT